MMKPILGAVLLVGGLILLPACRDEETTTERKVEKETTEAVDAAENWLENRKDAAAREFDEFMTDMEQGIRQLDRKAGDLDEEALEEWAELKSELNALFADLKVQARRLQKATKENWQDAKREFSSALAAAERKYQELEDWMDERID
ncbi:MAG: hypothetical protein ACLFVU_13800 [Phycisphaerae bacterium]